MFTTKEPIYSGSSLCGFQREHRAVVAVEESPHHKIHCSSTTAAHDATDATVTERLPPNVDPEVFKFLPKEIQMELLSSTPTHSVSSVSSAEPINVLHTTQSKSTESCKDSAHFNVLHQTGEKLELSEKRSLSHLPADMSSSSAENAFEEQTLSLPSSECEFPGNVDPKVFSELPLDVQQELKFEWKQKKPVFKSPSSRKPARSMMNKDRKTTGKNRQANSLFKYFKPS